MRLRRIRRDGTTVGSCLPDRKIVTCGMVWCGRAGTLVAFSTDDDGMLWWLSNRSQACRPQGSRRGFPRHPEQRQLEQSGWRIKEASRRL